MDPRAEVSTRRQALEKRISTLCMTMERVQPWTHHRHRIHSPRIADGAPRTSSPSAKHSWKHSLSACIAFFSLVGNLGLLISLRTLNLPPNAATCRAQRPSWTSSWARPICPDACGSSRRDRRAPPTRGKRTAPGKPLRGGDIPGTRQYQRYIDPLSGVWCDRDRRSGIDQLSRSNGCEFCAFPVAYKRRYSRPKARAAPSLTALSRGAMASKAARIGHCATMRVPEFCSESETTSGA